MSQKPISKRFLIHSATLKTAETRDKWDKVISATDVPLTFIRVDETNKLVQSSTNMEEQLTAIVFYDTINSRPQNVTFVKDQILVYNGDERRIKTIEPMYDNSRLHHYEIGII